jgi:PadR family transcriptional regulator, regulatory protein PadR
VVARRKRRISDETAAVLAFFLVDPGKERYGREIVIETKLKSGSLYPMLRRLESREILVSAWEDLQGAVDEGRRPRRLYRLRGTDEAQSLLAEWRAAQTSSRKSRIGGTLPA